MRGSQVWAGDNHSPFTKTHRLVVLSSLFQPLASPSLCWSQLPIAPSAVTGELGILPEWGANIFCRDSFNPLLGILLVVSHSLTALHLKNSYKDLTLTSKSCASISFWLRGPYHSSWLHPGLVWVIVPGKERGSGCQLQLGVWMNNKEIYKTSWNKGPGSLPATLSPFTHWLDHTSYITVSGLPCQWKQCTMMLECCFQRWKIQQIAFVYSIHCCYAGKL